MLPEVFGSGSFRPCVEDVKQSKAVLMYAILLSHRKKFCISVCCGSCHSGLLFHLDNNSFPIQVLVQRYSSAVGHPALDIRIPRYLSSYR